MNSFLRPGLVSVTFRQLTPREIVDLAAANGLEGIEWGADVHVPNTEIAREVGTMTRRAGLTVAGYGSYWRAEDEFLEVHGSFTPIVQAAILLGAPTIRVWAGTQSSASAQEVDRQRVTDALRRACEIAQVAGIAVSLEYHAGTLTDTLDSTLRLVREIDQPNLRLYWQPFPDRSPATRLDEVRAVLPWLSNLHVFQWTRPDSETLRHPLVEGADEWASILRLVWEEKNGGEGPSNRFALLEFLPNDDPALLPVEAATLRRLLADGS